MTKGGWRGLAKLLKEKGLKIKQIIKLLKIPKSTFYYKPKTKDNPEIIKMIKEIALKYPFYGYKRIWITMRKKGININKKKVYRIYKTLSLELKTRKKPKRKLQYSQDLTEPEFVNHTWNIDFTKTKINGKNIKILSIMDAFSRKTLKIYADISITSQDVVNILDKIFKNFKKTLIIRTDNGPEFRSKILQKFLFKHRIKQEFIPKGKPHKNGFIERLIRSIKEEGIYPHYFENIKELNKLLSKYTSPITQKTSLKPKL